jgi:aryl-alcohol dehydrogenase-like predicted oxidoreductase
VDWIVPLGTTGLKVSRIGLGSGDVGSSALDDATAGRLLNATLDAGITLVDTARGYGLAEERIGTHISHRRSEFVLSTKVGYSVDGFEDWTPGIIDAGIDRALKLMKTDVLDVVHLHSCPLGTLKNAGVCEALLRAKESGKILVAAYSGENEELEWAVSSGLFGCLQTSVNICDQLSLRRVLPEAVKRGTGVIAKRPVANAPWRFTERPVGSYAEEYWVRWKAMDLDPAGFSWQELAVRFAAYAPGVCSAIVGTGNLDHFLENVELARKGPLPVEMTDSILSAYAREDQGWTGQV